MFAGQLLEQALFGFLDLGGVLLETVFHVGQSMYHEAIEQSGQLSGQGQVGDEPTSATFDPPVEPAQGGVQTPSHAAGNHTEQSPGSIPLTPQRASALAALFAAGSQTQPGRKVLLALLIALQVRAHLTEKLQ